ncbi:hypothetical protein [Synechococcus sp. RedBA-s]|uniref:hypothetical protein n=1 Tax=Synechococcus sp. RedBA-s TaxID=2823741 RepID=UPI0020CEB6E0|nr:hypothetical protein [Synechococcus sp. RedBA-s]MCP9801909.1 hypothetical protein [Synechococcus sp. RedBA-s]
MFVVSEGMAHEIGPHPNLQVLPPWQLYYAGLCNELYKPLLEELIDAVVVDPCFALHCSGQDAHIHQMPAMNPRLCSSGFLDGEVWNCNSWIVEVIATGTRDGRDFRQTHLFLTSLRTTPEALLQLVHERWSIEGWH